MNDKKVVIYDHDPFVGGKESAYFELAKGLKDKNIIFAYTGSIDPIILNRMSSTCTIIDMNKSGKQIDCDVCIYSTVWHIETRIKAKEKMILWLHGMTKRLNVNKTIKFTHFVSVSETCASFYRRHYGIDSIVINNFVDMANIIRKSKEKYALPFGSGKDITLVTVSRISYEKGIEKLQYIARGLEKLGKDYKWYVVGEFNDPKLKEKIQTIYSHFPNIIFMGNMDNPHKLVRLCDVLVQLSVEETQGISPLEAKMLGKPLVLSDIKAFREFYPHDIKVTAYDETTIKKILEKKATPFKYKNDIKKWKELIYE